MCRNQFIPCDEDKIFHVSFPQKRAGPVLAGPCALIGFSARYLASFASVPAYCLLVSASARSKLWPLLAFGTIRFFVLLSVGLCTVAIAWSSRACIGTLIVGHEPPGFNFASLGCVLGRRCQIPGRTSRTREAKCGSADEIGHPLKSALPGGGDQVQAFPR